MFSIQKMFAKDDHLFKLLAASAEEGSASVQALKQILKVAQPGQSIADFVTARQKEREITGQISELLARSTVTSLDREDIEAISKALYKIPKTVQKFAERYLISVGQLTGIDFSAQVTHVEEAINIVSIMIKELERSEFERVNEQNERLRKTERAADELMTALLKDLYSGKFPPLTVVIVKDLYELLERIVDRCRDAGGVVANVVLKNS